QLVIPCFNGAAVVVDLIVFDQEGWAGAVCLHDDLKQVNAVGVFVQIVVIVVCDGSQRIAPLAQQLVSELFQLRVSVHVVLDQSVEAFLGPFQPFVDFGCLEVVVGGGLQAGQR